MMKIKVAAALALTALMVSPVYAAKHKACVWDLLGASGEVFNTMRDYALEAKGWGEDIELKPYTDERVAAEDFKAGVCDMAVITGLRARQFNGFVGSIDSVGAVPSNKAAQTLMSAISKPQLAAKMVNKGYEVAGVAPAGAVFLMVDDRSINTLAKAAGKKIAVLDFDKSQALMVQRVGAQPVASEVTNFAGKFNNGQVDIIAAPAAAFKPLELYKGLGTKGAIANLPVMYLTMVTLIKHDNYAAGFGQKSRDWITKRLPKNMAIIEAYEKAIPAKYWMEIPPADKIGYVKLMRELRIDMTKEGFYDSSMTKLMKRVRCQLEPSNFECALNDE